MSEYKGTQINKNGKIYNFVRLLNGPKGNIYMENYDGPKVDGQTFSQKQYQKYKIAKKVDNKIELIGSKLIIGPRYYVVDSIHGEYGQYAYLRDGYIDYIDDERPTWDDTTIIYHDPNRPRGNLNNGDIIETRLLKLEDCYKYIKDYNDGKIKTVNKEEEFDFEDF